MPNAVRCPLVIRPVNLPVPGLDDLQAEASAEGFQFIDTLIEQWSTGENRFNQPGEILLGILENDILIAIGGLNLDQFLNDPSIGRIRRVYVRRAWRSQGSGRALVTALPVMPASTSARSASAPSAPTLPASTNASASSRSTTPTPPTSMFSRLTARRLKAAAAAGCWRWQLAV